MIATRSWSGIAWARPRGVAGNRPRYATNGFGAPVLGHSTREGSSTRVTTWSTSPSPGAEAFGHRNGYGASSGAAQAQPAHTSDEGSEPAAAMLRIAAAVGTGDSLTAAPALPSGR